MTADAFTTAARAEAKRKYGSEVIAIGWKAIFSDAAEWTRDHLAVQEPTDAELDAAYDAFTAHSGPGREINEFNESCCTECGYAVGWRGMPVDGGRRAKRHAARAALTAAKEANR